MYLTNLKINYIQREKFMDDKVELATISATESGSLHLDIPGLKEDNRKLAPPEILMSAFFFRASKDSEWVQDLFDWFSEHYGEESEDAEDD